MKKEQAATASIVIDKLRPGIDGTCPVKLRVIYDRKYKDWVMKYPTEKKENSETLNRLVKVFQEKAGATIRMTEIDFKKASGTKPRGIFDSFKTMFQTYEETARDTISGIQDFSFELFEKNYFSNKEKTDLLAQLEATAKRLKGEGRISTARTFHCAYVSLKSFSGKAALPFKDVTVSFLKKYEAWMTNDREEKQPNGTTKTIQKNSLTTTGIYLRNVRTLFNEAKIKGLVYPFGMAKNGLYQIPKGRNIKKALTQAQVSTIAGHKCAGKIETRSRDFWLFSYLCNGINIKDMAKLKYSDVQKDPDGAKIHLIRAKTAGSVEERQLIEIIVTKQIGRIIDQWGNKPGNREQFIFPILAPGMTPELEYKAIQQAVQTINRNMKNVCEELKLPTVTTYTARHSFATVLKRSGASVEFISESLGHRNTQTTQSYLANFEDEEKRKWANVLLPENEETKKRTNKTTEQ